jgi:hypothetical protein
MISVLFTVILAVLGCVIVVFLVIATDQPPDSVATVLRTDQHSMVWPRLSAAKSAHPSLTNLLPFLHPNVCCIGFFPDMYGRTPWCPRVTPGRPRQSK